MGILQPDVSMLQVRDAYVMVQYLPCLMMLSGILLLDYPGLPLDGENGIIKPMSIEAESSLNAAIEWISNFLIAAAGRNCERVSPFLLHFLYKATSIYSRLQYPASQKSIDEKITILKDTLRLVNHRWLAAGKWMLPAFFVQIINFFFQGAYLSLLEKQQIMFVVRNNKSD